MPANKLLAMIGTQPHVEVAVGWTMSLPLRWSCERGNDIRTCILSAWAVIVSTCVGECFFFTVFCCDKCGEQGSSVKMFWNCFFSFFLSLVRTAHNFVLQKDRRITAAASLLIQSLWNVVYLLGLPRRCVLMQVSGAGGTMCVTTPCTHRHALWRMWRINSSPHPFFSTRYSYDAAFSSHHIGNGCPEVCVRISAQC